MSIFDPHSRGLSLRKLAIFCLSLPLPDTVLSTSSTPSSSTFSHKKNKKNTGELQEAAFQDLSGKNFSGKKFYKSILRGTIFDKANLEGANMFGSFCKGASFVGANLRNADLEASLFFFFFFQLTFFCCSPWNMNDAQPHFSLLLSFTKNKQKQNQTVGGL